MEGWHWALLLKPFLLLGLFALLVPFRVAVERFCPEGLVKRILLIRWSV